MAEETQSQAPVELSPSERAMLSRIDATVTLMTADIDHFLELDIGRLDRPESGTRITAGSEKANRQYRINYLKDQLGVDANAVQVGERTLSARLVADVAFDFVGLCGVVQMRRENSNDPSLDITKFNLLMQLRKVKGQCMETETATGKSYHASALDAWEFSPGRSENPTLPGDYGAILEQVLIGLKRRQLQQSTTTAS